MYATAQRRGGALPLGSRQLRAPGCSRRAPILRWPRRRRQPRSRWPERWASPRCPPPAAARLRQGSGVPGWAKAEESATLEAASKTHARWWLGAQEAPASPPSPTGSAELPRAAAQARPEEAQEAEVVAAKGGEGGGSLQPCWGTKSGSREARLQMRTRSKRWLKSVPPPSAEVDTPSACTHGGGRLGAG